MADLTIGVPAARREAIEAFLQEEGIDWTVSADGAGELTVVEAEGPESACDRRRLHAGGRIDCATALALAEERRVPSESIGRLMNLLGIRIRNCQLGCFR